MWIRLLAARSAMDTLVLPRTVNCGSTTIRSPT